MNLNKPGKLTQDEYEIFKRHPAYGKDILDPIKVLAPADPGVHLHHERWDGRGYPLGLKDNERSPSSPRIIAVADTIRRGGERRGLPARPSTYEVTVGQDRPLQRLADSARRFAHSFNAGLEAFLEELAAKGTKVPD